MSPLLFAMFVDDLELYLQNVVDYGLAIVSIVILLLFIFC